MFLLYVSDVDCEGFLRILTLMMRVVGSSYNSNLMRVTGGVYMPSCTSALSHDTFLLTDVLVC